MSFQGIRPNDLVKFRLPSGRVMTGRAQGKSIFPTHVVVSMFGYGHNRPEIVGENNYVSHKRNNFGKGLGHQQPPHWVPHE